MVLRKLKKVQKLRIKKITKINIYQPKKTMFKN